MPLFVPVIIIGANAVGIAAGGVSGVRGGMKIRRGRKLVRESLATHDARLREAREHRAQLQTLLRVYGDQRLDSSRRVLERAIAYLRAQGRLAELREIVPLAEVPMDDPVLPELPKLNSSSTAAATTILTAAQAANASPAALMNAAVQLGKASTGAAVKGLSGAAAKNASLAWLGGGAKAVGGGGMALGSAMGPLTAVGTAVTIAGLGANAIGEQTLTKATSAAADVDIASRSLGLFRTYLDATDTRTRELSESLEDLTLKAEHALTDLEESQLEIEGSEHLLGRTLNLVAAVGEIIRSDVLPESGVSDADSQSTRDQEAT